jgi:hypothetical protein
MSRDGGAAAREAVSEAIFHVRCSRILHTLLVHRVPDLLDRGPTASSTLAEAADLHQLSLERALRLLASFGLFVEVQEGVFANTEASELLRDREGGLRNWTLYATSRYIWDSIGATDHALRRGESAFVHEHGCTLWEYLHANPDDHAVFNAMFAELWAGEQPAIAAAYDWSEIEVVVDVGGGNGSLLATILERNDHLRGVLLDQQTVMSEADAHLRSRGVRHRCELIAGDFFEPIRAVGDVWVLSQILHDWDDERAGLILDRCRTQLRPGDRLLVAELVTVPCRPDRRVGITDINMLVLFGEARQRTAAEYEDLFARHGLELRAVVPTEGAFSIVEAGVA